MSKRRQTASERRARRRHVQEEQQRAVIRRVLAGEQTTLSVEEFPLVDRALDCAVPLFGYSSDVPDYPQGQGSGIAMVFRGVSLLVATLHEVNGAPPEGIRVPLGFGGAGRMSFDTGDGLATPRGLVWLRPDSDDDDLRDVPHFDLAAMFFDEPPRYTNDILPLNLERIAGPVAFKRDALFAIAGYPRSSALMKLDYDRGKLERGRFATFGRYVGAAPWSGCHSLAIDTSEIGGPDGLSGAPILRVQYDDDFNVEWAMAGVAVMGGPSVLHFIDVKHLVRLFGATAKRLGWPPNVEDDSAPFASGP